MWVPVNPGLVKPAHDLRSTCRHRDVLSRHDALSFFHALWGHWPISWVKTTQTKDASNVYLTIGEYRNPELELFLYQQIPILQKIGLFPKDGEKKAFKLNFGVAAISKLPVLSQLSGRFCKRALRKLGPLPKETCKFIDPPNGCYLIVVSRCYRNHDPLTRISGVKIATATQTIQQYCQSDTCQNKNQTPQPGLWCGGNDL